MDIKPFPTTFPSHKEVVQLVSDLEVHTWAALV